MLSGLGAARTAADPPSPSCRHRRELASREHILVHEPGAGQAAFAPNRRDMNAYRAELERKRLDQLDKEKREAAGLPAAAPKPTAGQQGQPAFIPTAPLAGLRISQPIKAGAAAAPGLPGLRMAMPRPAVARPVVARPQPRSAVATTTPTDSTPTPTTAASTVSSTTPHPAATDAPTVLHTDSSAKLEATPMLPSHLCSSYFVEPLSWMAGLVESGALAGKITCPNDKCAAKLGNFDWAGGRESKDDLV